LIGACALAFSTDVAYFSEYDDQFNYWIFGLVYDDRGAIFTSIWKGYPVIKILILGTVATLAFTWVINKLCLKAGDRVRIFIAPQPSWLRAVAVVLFLGVIVIGARGSAGIRPIQLKDAARTGDVFLNKVVINPFMALRFAIVQHSRMRSSHGLTAILPGGDVREAAATLFPKTAPAVNLDEALRRVAPGAPQPKPSHIFLVVMESYDYWSMQPGYSNFHLTDRMATFGREGIESRAFISAGNSTQESLTSIISGLPFAGVLVNYQPIARQGLPTSAAQIFKRLGYRTRFFYGGYLSWQRIGEFCREQGFDEVYGGDKMSEHPSGNEWGVEDEILFRFIAEHTDDEPTFNVIMTTSYHPPHSVDVVAKGFQISTLQTNSLCQGLSRRTLEVLGHLWYSDKCLGDFIDACEAKLDRPLFALTGDHFSRAECIIRRPNLFERRAVPCVLYGRKALENVPRPTNAIVGSHIDMVPTLVNLAASQGFIYHSLGRDMLDSSQPQLGFGADAVFGTNSVLFNVDPAEYEDLVGKALNPTPETQELALRHRQLLALSWWRAMKGNQWPPDHSQSARKDID
jgi:phosphoglycerol transferase MdoB-like AlkP superfamily enzyme